MRWIQEATAKAGHWLRKWSSVLHPASCAGRVLSILVTAAILGLLAWRLVVDWRNLPPGFFSKVRLDLLLASVAALVPALLLVSLRWGLTLRTMKVPIGWWTSVRIWFLSQAGRYLPGGVWSYVGRFYLSRAEMTKEAIFGSIVLETGLRVVSEVLIFVLSLFFWTDTGFISSRMLLLVISGVAGGLLLLHPAVLERLSKTSLLRRAGLGPIDVPVRYRTILVLLLPYYLLTVVVVGVAFHLLVAALYPVPVRLLPALTGSFAAAVVLGFLVPVTPNGWGVREGVLTFLLSQAVPSSVAIVIAVVARIWLGVGEAMWILIAMYSEWRRSKPGKAGNNPKGLLTGRAE